MTDLDCPICGAPAEPHAHLTADSPDAAVYQCAAGHTIVVRRFVFDDQPVELTERHPSRGPVRWYRRAG